MVTRKEKSGYKEYILDGVPVRSMLEKGELVLLYLAGRSHQGKGAIVDLGPLLGASTACLAQGALDGGHEDSVIDSFDLWHINNYEGFLKDLNCSPAGSLLGGFNNRMQNHLTRVRPHQGDFLDWQWGDAPIEILFVDLSKTWSLENHLMKTMMPKLIPGGLLIHQDYIHHNEYWIHINMERYRDHFTHLGFVYGATSWYRCEKPIPAGEMLSEDLSYKEKMDLLTSARSRAAPSVKEVMKTAAAKCAIENGDVETAQALIDSVSYEVLGEEPLHHFQGIAKTGVAVVQAMIDSYEAPPKRRAFLKNGNFSSRLPLLFCGYSDILLCFSAVKLITERTRGFYFACASLA